MTRQEIEKRCEELAEEWIRENLSPLAWTRNEIDDIKLYFKEGFTDAIDLTWPMIEEARTEAERLADVLEEFIKHTSSNLEDMQRYFENECHPTDDEIAQCYINIHIARLALANYREKFPKGEE